MSLLDTLTDPQRRHLAHLYAALTEHIHDEIEYDREPTFPEPDEDVHHTLYTVMSHALTELMYEAHPEEAAAIEAKVAAQRAGWKAAWEVAGADLPTLKPFLCPHCAATTTVAADWAALEWLEFVGLLAVHRGGCGERAWLHLGQASPDGTRRIVATPVPVGADPVPGRIVGYAHICTNRACPDEGLADPLADGEDVTQADTCPTCGAVRKVYTTRDGPLPGMQSFSTDEPDADASGH